MEQSRYSEANSYSVIQKFTAYYLNVSWLYMVLYPKGQRNTKYSATRFSSVWDNG
jgi:hypothetical protein